MYEYEHVRRVSYEGGATFVPRCTKCERFVKADKKIIVTGEGLLVDQPNATCAKCGRTEMIFEGFM